MSEHTTQIHELKRLRRSRSDRMLAGVCGGLARYFEIHPAVFRVGFVVLALLGGAGIFIYAAAALVMPDEGKEESVATAALRNRKDHPWPLIGLGLLAVGGALLLSRATLLPDADTWFLFLIAGALILWVTRKTTEPPAESTVETTAESALEATEETAVDTTEETAVDTTEETTVDTTEETTVDTTEETTVETTKRPRRLRRAVVTTGIVLASLLAAALIAVGVVFAVFDVDRSFGERDFAMTSVEDLRSEYRLGIGSMNLDLGKLQLPEGETRVVEARVDIGDLEVIVPAGVALEVHGTAELGSVEVLDHEENGNNVDVDLVETGTRVLVLDAHVGAGAVRVERDVP